MMKKQVLVFILFMAATGALAQDTLPSFGAKLRKDGLAEISWYNDYGIVKQVTLQRSLDSLQKFISIATMPNPMLKTNLYIDKKPNAANYYYRIYVQLPEGQIVFTTAKKPTKYQKELPGVKSQGTDKDSMLTAEKLIPFIPSEFVFTDKKNNVLLVFPNAENHQYRVVFYDKNYTRILTIPKVKESNLILEKYNFMRSGWYFFELFDGDKLLEKNKFLISKE